MKIKVARYKSQRSERTNRLTIDIGIELPDGGSLNTSAKIQLYPLDNYSDKSPEVAFGMLYLSAIVYAIDRSVSRAVYSIDGWSREFDVDVLLPEYEKFHSLEASINAMLSFLTGDYWTCHFVGNASVGHLNNKLSPRIDGITQVNLFSGGMDSLIGAIDYMTSHPTGKLFLASHYDSYMPGPLSDQQRLIKLLSSKYMRKFCPLSAHKPAVNIEPRLSVELSCRSRSLMFLSIALVIASYAGCEIGVPENGSVSLNFPLSKSRRASCSTRTTHPLFLRMFKDIIAKLGLQVGVSNPYEKMTKGEMVKACADKDYLLGIVALSNSCGKRSKHQYNYDCRTASHCGRCMPCMYRKAALIGEHDATSYGNKLVTLFGKKGCGVSKDMFAMLDFLKRDISLEEIRRELRVAGMSGFSDIDDYADLVERTRSELKAMVVAESSRSMLHYMGW